MRTKLRYLCVRMEINYDFACLVILSTVCRSDAQQLIFMIKLLATELQAVLNL